MPARIVTRGVILRALGGKMRKFKTRSAAQFAVSFARDFGGRVAAARGFRPVRECPGLTPFLRF